MNVLIVESSQLYREILQQSFNRFRGVDFTLLASAAEAVSETARKAFDFVVISGQLSDSDGLSLGRRLRSDGLVPVAPVVLLTASPSAELAAQAEQAGITEIFRKQDLDELVAFARHFLDAQQPLRCRILYVEDALELRLPLVEQLREWGADVDAFAPPDEEWPVFLREDYDLVITDVVLGGHMTGSRLINRLRRQELAKGATPVLAVTAFDSAQRRVELFHLGIDDQILYEGKLVWLGLANDVTEKHKARELLQKTYEEIRQLASNLQSIREDERTNIAREIHDELGQQLTGLKMDIHWLSRKVKNADDEINEKMKESIDLINATITSVRKIATDLRPSISDDLGLLAALEWQGEEFEKRSGTKVKFINKAGDMEVRPEVATALFRIYQELLPILHAMPMQGW